MCGENESVNDPNANMAGSSPRVRGKLSAAAKPPSPPGLIPACAGKTLAKLNIPRCLRAHPRVCGENVLATVQSTTLRGSSPRVRGKLVCHGADPRAAGLIPACAGKTTAKQTSSTHRPAHPRVCGENPLAVSITSLSVGSSPRVRGKREIRGFAGVEVRLIPACAGKTCDPAAGWFGAGAHPRVCGENRRYLLMGQAGRGSSPRVRGKLYP